MYCGGPHYLGTSVPCLWRYIGLQGKEKLRAKSCLGRQQPRCATIKWASPLFHPLGSFRKEVTLAVNGDIGRRKRCCMVEMKEQEQLSGRWAASTRKRWCSPGSLRVQHWGSDWYRRPKTLCYFLLEFVSDFRISPIAIRDGVERQRGGMGDVERKEMLIFFMDPFGTQVGSSHSNNSGDTWIARLVWIAIGDPTRSLPS